MTPKDLEAHVTALEAFVTEAVEAHSFTKYGRTPEDNVAMRTPLGNKGAALLGLPVLPTLGGLDTTLDART